MAVLRAVLVAAVAFLTFIATAFGQPVAWTGAGDGTSWNNPNNWSPVGLPGATNDVTIGAGATAVNVNVSPSIRSLTLGRTVDITGCNILNTTNGVTFTGAAGIINTSPLGCESLRFTGTQSVTGTGVINVNVGTMRLSGGASLTLGAGVQLNSGGSGGTSIVFEAGTTLNNQGTIRATGAGRSLTVGNSGGTFNNLAGGLVSAESSATLSIASQWTNAGTFNINGGTLSLGGSFTTLGTVTRTGGTLEFTGAFSGPALTATAATGSISLGGNFSATGTAIGASGGSSFIITGNPTFTNVTLGAPVVGGPGC
ncbi:MAG TPA: hypothetical protein VEB22_09000, partial [Phycisphaerales bacterium]|nr:hypothetical protein [Phycisphaerales bacterium]